MKRLLLALPACLALSACAVTPPAVQGSYGRPSPSVPADTAAASPGATTCQYRQTGTPSRPVDPPEGSNVPATGVVGVSLRLGAAAVGLELDRAAAPCTVHSFESLARQGWYDDTTCHRLSTRGIFILQCGDPTGTGRGGPGYSFDDELTGRETYPAGTLAMANSGPDTNGSQFFLVYADTPLPPGYTVFGRLDAVGVEAVAGIAAQGHDSSYGDGTGRPNAPATISAVALG